MSARCSKCGGVAGAVRPATPVFHGFGAPAPCDCAKAETQERLARQDAFPACRYCGDRVGTKGAVHNRCEREADRLIDEGES